MDNPHYQKPKEFTVQWREPEALVEALGPAGPWFVAAYSGRCSTCDERFEDGDSIRADGEGGYECCD